ncbi:aldolase/citrate lyase family protein [Deltaproteobacteria bacterium TL4]
MERRKALKNKLRTRKKVTACWTSIGHPSITEIFARTGSDFLGIDIEHSTISQEQSQRIIAACQANGIVCLPRIASHNGEMIKRLLDSGADGLIVPMVSTPEEVEQIIQWSKYTPVGNRSYGIARGQGYGFDFEEHITTWNESSIIIIQIESIQGVENIDKLLGYEEIDGAMIGPYDLSGTLKVPGQLDHPLVVAAGKKVMDACVKYGKSCGTQDPDPSQKTIEEKFQNGFTFVVLGSDIFLMWKWAEKIKQYRTALGLKR